MIFPGACTSSPPISSSMVPIGPFLPSFRCFKTGAMMGGNRAPERNGPLTSTTTPSTLCRSALDGLPLSLIGVGRGLTPLSVRLPRFFFFLRSGVSMPFFPNTGAVKPVGAALFFFMSSNCFLFSALTCDMYCSRLCPIAIAPFIYWFRTTG